METVGKLAVYVIVAAIAYACMRLGFEYFGFNDIGGPSFWFGFFWASILANLLRLLRIFEP